MAAKIKRVVYFNILHSFYEDLLAKRADVLLTRLTPDGAETAAAMEAAHIYQISSDRHSVDPRYLVERELLARMPNLLVVSTGGAGFDTVNLAACTEAGVLAVNQAGGNREAVAEHVLAMMLTLSKRLIETDRMLRRGEFIDRTVYTGSELVNKIVGVVGLGNVGSRVAELCRGLFGMTVLAYDPYLSADEIKKRGAEKVELDDLLRRSDYVSINCPLTDETRGMIGSRQFAMMQPHTFFIATSRGGIYDEPALAEALRTRKVAGAGLDVWAMEPPAPEHPLLAFDNVLASPHTAGGTNESRLNMAKFAAEQIIAILDGKRPPRLLNPQSWPAFCKRFEHAFGISPQG